MAIRESASSAFAAGLQKCAAVGLPAVHKHCFQVDQTRHVTLLEGTWTLQQVRSLRFADPFSPVTIEFQGRKNWKAGCYLSLTHSTTRQLQALLQRMDNLPIKREGNRSLCNHVSLYRKRGFASGPVDFDAIRHALAKHDWGTVQGVSLRIKALGTG